MLSTLITLAQTSSGYYDYDYSYSTNTLTDQEAATAAVFGLGFLMFMLLFAVVAYVIMAVSLMKIFKKAGRDDAWAAWIPIYNMYVMYEVAGRPGWWVFLGFIPFVGGMIAFVTSIIAMIDLAKSFGKSTGYAILLILLPFIGFPMLGFGDSKYEGPAGPEGNKQAPPATPQTPAQPAA